MTPTQGGLRTTHRHATARAKFGAALAAGIVTTVVAALLGVGRSAPLLGWDVMGLVFCVWTWAGLWSMDATSTSVHAQHEEPGRDVFRLILVTAAVASLVAVGVVLFGASSEDGSGRYVHAALALVSVFLSWTLIHTLYTLKYATLYYDGEPGGVDFHDADAPDYRDFAYLAFTLGMTFQVSDTDLQTKAIRRTALKHAWLSFPLGAVIIAASINLVSGLAK
jgi:uncharacterized membrane protein